MVQTSSMSHQTHHQAKTIGKSDQALSMISGCWRAYVQGCKHLYFTTREDSNKRAVSDSQMCTLHAFYIPTMQSVMKRRTPTRRHNQNAFWKRKRKAYRVPYLLPSAQYALCQTVQPGPPYQICYKLPVHHNWQKSHFGVLRKIDSNL